MHGQIQQWSQCENYSFTLSRSRNTYLLRMLSQHKQSRHPHNLSFAPTIRGRYSFFDAISWRGRTWHTNNVWKQLSRHSQSVVIQGKGVTKEGLDISRFSVVDQYSTLLRKFNEYLYSARLYDVLFQVYASHSSRTIIQLQVFCSNFSDHTPEEWSALYGTNQFAFGMWSLVFGTSCIVIVFQF